MFFHTGRVFEIYSIGDGLYMGRILNSVAAMSNDGLLLQLVALGLMIGLLIMGVKNVINGGMKLEIGTLFASFLLAVFLFGMRADVVILDMSYVPGQKVQGDIPVANLPFGVAATGSLVSTVGFTLTEKMEQGFSVPQMTTLGMSRGGFGKILEWVNSIRLWERPVAESTTTRDLAKFKHNLNAYLLECTLPAVEMGHIRLEGVRATTEPLSMHVDGSGGIGYNSNYLMVRLMTSATSGGGTQFETKTCAAGHADLVAQSTGGVTAFYNMLGVYFPDSGSALSAQDTFANAYQAIGVASSDVMGITLANAVGSSLDVAMRSYEHRVSLSKMSELMIEQASQQRLVQWAAEETMFRRIMRPMMAFFESLMYALSPFMALAIGLGTFGIATVFRYMMLTIWVSLWMPVLAIIQLFQITSVQHVVTALHDPMMGADNHGITSIAGAEMLRSEALEWMATGAALAAWTPAITMALVFSGAITASALAGKLQGQDTINEKMAAPDVVNTPPAIQRGSMGEFTQAGGGKIGGGSMPTIDWSNQSSLQTASVNEANQQLSKAIVNAIRTNGSASFDDTDRREFLQDNGLVGTAAEGRSGTSSRSGGTGHSNSQGSDASFSNSREQSAREFQATFMGWSATVGMGGSGGAPGVGMSGGHRRGSEAATSQTAAERAGGGKSIGKDESESGGWSNSQYGQNSLTDIASIRQAASEGKSWAQKIVNAVDNSEEVRAAQGRVEGYRQSAENTHRSGVGHSEGVHDFVGRMFRQSPGGAEAVTGALKSAVAQTNSGVAFEHAKATLGAMGMSGAQLEAGAAVLALSGYSDNAVAGKSEAANMSSMRARAAAMGDALDGSYSGQLNGAFHANSNAGIGSSVPSYSEGAAALTRPTAPNINMGQLQATLAGGAPAANLSSPGHVAGNTPGSPSNLDPSAARGEAPFGAAKIRGELLRGEVGQEGYRAIAQQHQDRLQGGIEVRSLPAHVAAPNPGEFVNPQTFTGTLPGNGNQQFFDSEREQLKDLLPGASDPVINAVAVSNMQSRGLGVGEDIASSVNSQVYNMSREEYGTFLGYVDQGNGDHRLARDAALEKAGDGYAPDVLLPASWGSGVDVGGPKADGSEK